MEEQQVEEQMKEFLDLVSPEELREFQRLQKKIQQAASGRTEKDKPIDDAGYYYGESHPEYVNEDVTHLFITVKTELHHMNDECTELTGIEQINSLDYHVVVKPGMDPVNLAKDFTETLDKSLDASYVNIEKEIEKQKTDEA